MVKFYFKRVINGKTKWTEVPKLWKDDVIDELKSAGYELNEDGTVTLKE